MTKFNNIVSDLEKISKWKRLVELNNNNRQSVFHNVGKLQVTVYDKNLNEAAYLSDEIKLYISDDNGRPGLNAGDLILGISPTLKLAASPQTMYLYQYFLNDDYSVQFLEDPKTYRPYQEGAHDITVWSNIHGFGPTAGSFQTLGFLKLLITTESFDHFQLLQSGIMPESTDVSREKTRSASEPVTDDWTAITTRLTVSREFETDQNGNIELANGDLTINCSSGPIQVSIGMTEINSGSLDPLHQFRGLVREGFELLQFTHVTAGQMFDIIEFTPDQLQKTTIDLTLTNREANQEIIAVAFNGADFQSVGSCNIQDGVGTIDLTDLPELTYETSENGQVKSPFSVQRADPSLFMKLKVGLFALDPSKRGSADFDWQDFSLDQDPSERG